MHSHPSHPDPYHHPHSLDYARARLARRARGGREADRQRRRMHDETRRRLQAHQEDYERRRLADESARRRLLQQEAQRRATRP